MFVEMMRNRHEITLGVKILFVDADDAELLVCRAHCAEEFEVLTARTSADALSLLEREEIGVVIAAGQLADGAGVELLASLRDSHPDVLRILVTAPSEVDAAIDAIQRGDARRHLDKPWHPVKLLAELRDALDVYETSRRLRALGRRLRETERVYALGIIAAGVGHELRNPVCWIHGNLQLIKNQIGGVETLVGEERSPELADSLTKIHRLLDDAEDGVNRVFDIVRGMGVPVQSMPPSERDVDLEAVVQLTLRLVAGELRGVAAVECDFRTRARVVGTTTKVGQIVLNLVVNAMQALTERRHGADDGLIRITSFAANGWAELQVSDNGGGVEPESRRQIFDPFYTTKSDSGTGLGLAICRRIAEELGGTVDVDTDPELGGARFRLRLPLS